MDGNSFKGQVLEFNRHPHNREAIKLDLVDRKILYLLSENARYSHTSLAKKLKIKRETISYRIKKMMDHDFLHGYLTLLDHRRLGFKNYLVYLKLRTVHNEKELLDYLSHFNEITRLKNCSGSFDVQIVSTVKKEEDFLEMMEKITNNYHSLIQRSEILKIIEEDFLGLSLLLNQDTSTNLKIIEHKGSSFQKEFGKHDPEVNLNQKDKDILNILKLDAKISIKNLSQKVNLSSISVENRIKKADKIIEILRGE